MWFLAWLCAGVILGFFLAGLCNIASKGDEGYLESCADSLEGKIETVA
jgi:hypothetical protein